MNARGLWVAVAVMLAASGCTREVYYAVMAPHASMDDGGCLRQCQMLHAGQTKQLLSCADTCPEVRIVKEKTCKQVSYDAEETACTTARNQTFDGVGTGLLIGLLVAVNVAVVLVIAASNQPPQYAARQ
jgi:hypothetical protein